MVQRLKCVHVPTQQHVELYQIGLHGIPIQSNRVRYLQYKINQISFPDQYSAQFGSSGNATLKHKCLGFTEYVTKTSMNNCITHTLIRK